MSLVHNERTKLLANALDRASTACLTVGVFGPLVAYVYNFGGSALAPVAIFLGSLFWLAAACGLHWIGRQILGRLM